MRRETRGRSSRGAPGPSAGMAAGGAPARRGPRGAVLCPPPAPTQLSSPLGVRALDGWSRRFEPPSSPGCRRRPAAPPGAEALLPCAPVPRGGTGGIVVRWEPQMPREAWASRPGQPWPLLLVLLQKHRHHDPSVARRTGGNCRGGEARQLTVNAGQWGAWTSPGQRHSLLTPRSDVFGPHLLLGGAQSQCTSSCHDRSSCLIGPRGWKGGAAHAVG